VFDEPYEFRILFAQARGRTEARLVFVRDGVEVHPTRAAGGGVVDVASFALRLACLVYHQPKLRPVMILDEPFKFVSEEYRDRCRELIEMLAAEMGVQFIIVTHIKELETGKVVRL
jgi:DNA repair exonuclease SbcCD ATPase subunit